MLSWNTDTLDGCNPEKIGIPVSDNKPNGAGTENWNLAHKLNASIFFNKEAGRIEIFPENGGWFGIYPNNKWVYDIAPFCG